MNSIKKLWVIYVVCLHILIVVVLSKSNFIEKVGIRTGLYVPPDLAGYYREMVEYHKRMDGSVPEGAVIYIGDSITQGLATAAVSEVSVNYGIGSDTTVGVLNRLPVYSSIRSARAVVIAIGVNDLARRSNNELLQNYKQILTFLGQNANVVVSAILPVAEGVGSVHFSNARIMTVNSSLKDMVTKYKNVDFIDAGGLLADLDGNLKTEYHTGDGVHLNTAGYGVWIDLLRTRVGPLSDIGATVEEPPKF